MSRYLILFIINLPLILAAIIGALVDYKMKKIPRRKFIIQIAIWVVILAGIGSASFIYQFLFDNNLTRTEPLSLFDVIQITGIIFVLYLANRARIKADRLEKRINDLHRELSIKLSED